LVSALEDNRQMVVERLGPEQDAVITQMLAESQILRDNGGVGVSIIFILVPEANIGHITPFKWAEPLSGVNYNKDWEADLKEMVRRGTTF
jgi:hypothetical protein